MIVVDSIGDLAHAASLVAAGDARAGLRGSAAAARTITDDDVLAHTGFAPDAQASLRLELPPAATPYSFLACTFEPGQQARASHRRALAQAERA